MTANWTTPAELRAQVERLWRRDQLLEAVFPLRLKLRVPESAALSPRFGDVREWLAHLQQGSHQGYRLVFRELQHRVIGNNSLPAEAWVDTLDDALRLAGKLGEGRAYARMRAATAQQQPALLPWLRQQPQRALALADDWPLLLDFVAWLQAHPRPGVFLRQVDLPGLHSKFIESHRAVLAELLDLALPATAVDPAARGVAQFAARYGFLDKPMRVRLRFLDPRQVAWVPGTDADYTLSAAAFAQLGPPLQQVFITENEVNFLTFPPVAAGLVVFGAGYGFDALAQAAWLHGCALHYWGDIDTHGFAILDQLRGHFPQVRSFLMDRATLWAHEGQWVAEPQPIQRDLPHLQADEQLLYDDLRWRRLRDLPVRLEQERLAFGWVQQAVAEL